MSTNLFIPQHVFLSYSHRDEAFANRLAFDLTSEGLNVWVDRTGLAPGTPNWEQTVRDALDHAFALVLIATPASRQSSAVQGEVAIARSKNVPVYPVWAEGNEWTECIPLTMIHAQYIDCRDALYEANLTRVVAALRASDAYKPRQLTVDLHNMPTGAIHFDLSAIIDSGNWTTSTSPASYQSLQGLLNDLYLSYLDRVVRVYTYGQDWVLVSQSYGVQRVLVPWSWLLPLRRSESLHDSHPGWASDPPEVYGVLPDTHWKAIWTTKGRQPACMGIATNDVWFARYGASLAMPGAGDAITAAKRLTSFMEVSVRILSARYHGTYEENGGYIKFIGLQERPPDPFHNALVLTAPREFDGTALAYYNPSGSANPIWL